MQNKSKSESDVQITDAEGDVSNVNKEGKGSGIVNNNVGNVINIKQPIQINIINDGKQTVENALKKDMKSNDLTIKKRFNRIDTQEKNSNKNNNINTNGPDILSILIRNKSRRINRNIQINSFDPKNKEEDRASKDNYMSNNIKKIFVINKRNNVKKESLNNGLIFKRGKKCAVDSVKNNIQGDNDSNVTITSSFRALKNNLNNDNV